MNILHFSLHEGYITGFKAFLQNYCNKNLLRIDFINQINEFESIKNKNIYDLIICSGYKELNLIFLNDFKNKIIVLDYHMLSNFLESGGYKLAEKISNYNNIEIYSPFIKFIKYYYNFGLNNNGKETGNFLNKIKWCHFPIDINYINKVLNSLKKEDSDDFILIPGNRKREYNLLFKSIKIAEENNIFFKYKIYDNGVKKEKIYELVKNYKVKSDIFFGGNLEYDDFLKEIYKSLFIILPLKNIESICNGLTAHLPQIKK